MSLLFYNKPYKKKELDPKATEIEKLTLLENDLISLIGITSQLIPISKLIGIEEGSTYCPFHSDEIHKSAKVYEDIDGISRLYCFGQCRTQYTSYEYIKKVLKKSPLQYLMQVYPKQKIIEYYENYEQEINQSDKKINYVKEKYNESKNLIEFIDKIYGV